MANLSNINNKFLVTTGGNVLIGQTSAVGSSILQVTGNSTFAGTIASNNIAITNSGNGELSATRTSGATVKSIAQSARGQIGTSSNHELQLITNSTSRLTIDTSGNATFAGLVKINTGAQSSNPRLYFQHDNIDVNNFIEVDRGTNAMEFYNNGSSDRDWET